MVHRPNYIGPGRIHQNNADDVARISTFLYTVNAHRVIYRAVTKGEAWFERKGFNVNPVSQCSMLYYINGQLMLLTH